MAHDAAVDTKMKYLSKEHSLTLVADNKKQVVILHSLKNYGGTILQPVSKVAALLGLGPHAPLPHKTNILNPRPTSLPQT